MSEKYENLAIDNPVAVEIDKPHEECGVVGIILPTEQEYIAQSVTNGLFAIQHRGQEAAGLSVTTASGDTKICKDAGLVSEVFGGNVLSGLSAGKIGVGHVRYGTFKHGSAKGGFNEAGPSNAETDDNHDLIVSHNGHINNIEEIRNKFDLNGTRAYTDSHLLALAIGKAKKPGVSLEEAMIEVFSVASGAMSIVAMSDGQLAGFRDPHGFRPLVLGTFRGGGYAFASEVPALDAMGAKFRRQVSRGELVICGPDGSISSTFAFDEQPSRLCAFELIYISAPHGELEGRSIHMVRKKMGELLAAECPADADVVVGIPDSGTPAAEGFAQASGIPKVSGFYKHKYMARTFIMPDQGERQRAIKQKLAVTQPEVYGKRLVVVDDSIIRGNTTKEAVAMLRQNGAAEIHMRVTSAPYRWPCFYGMDTYERNELIANQYPDHDKLCEYLGVDSLGYLSIEGLRTAAADAAGKLCMACMDGKYPTPVELSQQ